MKKINLFLAGSPMEIISGLACISEIKPPNPVFFIERNITESPTAVEILIASAALRFPNVSFHVFALDREGVDLNVKGKWRILRRYHWIKEHRAGIDAAVQNSFGTTLDNLGEQIECIHFTYLSEYVRILLEACRQCPRALYPHGFECPRFQQIRDKPFLFQPRGPLTALRSLHHTKPTTGMGEVLISSLHRLCGKRATCVPFDGSDKVYTFRQSPVNIKTELVRLHELKDTFEWLTTASPWQEELEKSRQIISADSVVLLLSEYQRNPIWMENRNWAEAHLSIARATLKRVGSSSLVIKAHPRSDGTAAAYLHDLARETLPQVTCDLLPSSLSLLPIEALALAFKFSAACSLGSCSLPGDIGINVPHYTSSRISAFFDEGWNGVPFWAKYGQITQMLVSEGISQDIDNLA